MTVRADHTALKGPCEHNLYDAHSWRKDDHFYETHGFCPGGVLLPPGSIVIVKGELGWWLSDVERLAQAFSLAAGWTFYSIDPPDAGPRARDAATRILDALAAARTGEETE